MLLPSAVLHKKSVPLGGSFSSNTPGPGNFSVPSGVTSINIKIWGAGASGARGTVGATGGGAGAYCEKSNISVTPGQNVPYSIGLRGSAPTSGVASLGNTGGSTTILTLTAGGGERGKYFGYEGYGVHTAAGGVASGGDVNTAGGSSSAWFNQNATGGASPSGGAGGATGSDGSAPGGGGGGNSGSTPGNGANGRLEITW